MRVGGSGKEGKGWGRQMRGVASEARTHQPPVIMIKSIQKDAGYCTCTYMYMYIQWNLDRPWQTMLA